MNARKRPTFMLSRELRERLFGSRAPNEALTIEEWRALGYDADGDQARPLTQDPIGTYPHPSKKLGDQ